jgi:hypothetical protein
VGSRRAAGGDQGLDPVPQLAERPRVPAVGFARRRDFGWPGAFEAGHGRLFPERHGPSLFGQRERVAGVAWVELWTGLQAGHEGCERVGFLDLGKCRSQALHCVFLSANRSLQARSGGSRLAREPRHLLFHLLWCRACVEEGGRRCQREVAEGDAGCTPLRQSANERRPDSVAQTCLPGLCALAPGSHLAPQECLDVLPEQPSSVLRQAALEQQVEPRVAVRGDRRHL